LKIRADEHVSPKIVAAIREIGLKGGDWEVSSVIEVGASGSEDAHWITAFSQHGGDAILTADADFVKRPPQVKAVFDTGLKVIHLPGKWGNSSGDIQAAFMLMWWSRIEKCLETMKPRECFQPPWNIRMDGDLRKVKLDFHRAEKRLKKSKPGKLAGNR